MTDLKALMRIVDNEQERCSRILARYWTDAQFHAIVKRLAEWIQTASIPIHSGDLRDACECAAMITQGDAVEPIKWFAVEDFTIDLDSARQEWRGIPPKPIVMDSFRPKSDPSTCSNCRHWQQRKRKGQRGKCPILGQMTKPSMGCTSWAAKDRDTCQNCANRDALQCRLSTASVTPIDAACDSFKPRSCSTCAHWAATDRSAMSAKCRHRLRTGWTMKHDARCEHWDRMAFREDDE